MRATVVAIGANLNSRKGVRCYGWIGWNARGERGYTQKREGKGKNEDRERVRFFYREGGMRRWKRGGNLVNGFPFALHFRDELSGIKIPSQLP